MITIEQIIKGISECADRVMANIPNDIQDRKRELDIEIKGHSAIVTINSKTREFSLWWETGDSVPQFEFPVDVGVTLGNTGSKVWSSTLVIKVNRQYSESRGNTKYVLEAYSPLNTVNHKHTHAKIVGFWDLIDDSMKSKR